MSVVYVRLKLLTVCTVLGGFVNVQLLWMSNKQSGVKRTISSRIKEEKGDEIEKPLKI